MKGYKVFNPDWTCKGMKYEVGKTYEYKGEIGLCKAGYHFCRRLTDCFNFYSFDPNNKVAEIEALGIVHTSGKSVTDRIRIVRELSWYEVLDLCNTGDWNTGDRNTGNWNTGDWNTGDWNTGNCNTGDWNTGNRNTGNFNTGNSNTGNSNTGSFNTGSSNTGSSNTGSFNTGNSNTGNFNTGSFNTGFFNTTEPTVRMFDKDTGLKMCEIDIPLFLCFDLTVWVSHDTATDEEKEVHKKEIECCGGFLKRLEYKEAFRLAWDKASEEEHEQVKRLPNFDAEKFYEISGIRV